MANCTVEACEKLASARGYCSGHYHRLRRYGDPCHSPEPRQTSRCAVDGCSRSVGRTGGGGFCRKHYKRLRAHGNPLGGGIDHGAARDFVLEVIAWPPQSDCITWPFGTDADGYGRVKWGGKPSHVHVVVAELTHGRRPSAKHDACHSCGRGHLACVNPKHLYWGTRRQNVADAISHGTAVFWGRRMVPVATNTRPQARAA